MNARSDDVPDFYGAEPMPSDDFDPWGSSRCASCANAELCQWLAWYVADRCGEDDPDGMAADVLTDGHACGECTMYEGTETR